MKLEGLSILGADRAQPAGQTTPAVNPATAERLEPGYHWATPVDVDRAARLATEAFAQYSQWSGSRKAGLLRKIAEWIEQQAVAIQERAHLETALPLARLQGETARTCGQLRLFATLVEEGGWVAARIDHADPDRQPAPKPDVRSMQVPLGPAAVFSSSNFPLAFSVAGGDTAAALAAGCPVLVKPHQGHMGTSEMVGVCVQRAVQECHAPAGLFSLLYGPGREIGVALVKHPLIKSVGFTGSRAGGRALMDAAASRPEPIPVYAEMGSINPVFLLRSAVEADPEKLAAALHASVTLGVGQFCTNPGLVLVESGPATDRFMNKLSGLMQTTPAGTMLTAGLCSAYRQGVEQFSRIPKVRRVSATNPTENRPQAAAALFVTDADTFLMQADLMNEVFGPCTLVVQCAQRSQMIAAAQKLEGQLTATVHGSTDELNETRELVEILSRKSGRLLWNGFPTGVEVCHAMTHGGPYPATSDGRSTSVGTRAIERFTRPLCLQNWPEAALPPELQEANPLGIRRLVDGRWQ